MQAKYFPPKLYIAPSILAADFANLGQEVKAIEVAGADRVHFDVMDNHYVPNLSVGPMVCRAIYPLVNIPIDVHLMAKPVDELILSFARAGANMITFHPEATQHIDRSLSLIKAQGCMAGLALNPATPITCMDYVMDKLDLVLVMSVNPGFGGQSFIPATLQKIRDIRDKLDRYLECSQRRILLEVDGGIKKENIRDIVGAGTDICVAGSAVFNAPDPDGGYKNIIHSLRTHAIGYS
jgi:ribulose-phosphate 3-epimerase